MKFTRGELFNLATADGGGFRTDNLNESYDFCRKIATGHYENFPVGSVLIPRAKRKHFYSVYAFARIADDIADELTDDDQDTRLEVLSRLDQLLRNPRTVAGNPVFMALHSTMHELNIPETPLIKLLIAFRRDVCFSQPESFADLEDYCIYSANPIGELVLRIFGSYNNTTARHSDMICTGLQLVNFWQDLSVDIPRGRYYIPRNILAKYGFNEENLQENFFSPKLEPCMKELYDYTENFFINGSALIPQLASYRLRAEIRAVVEGGTIVLEKLRELGIKVFGQRPRLERRDLAKIFFYSFLYRRVVV